MNRRKFLLAAAATGTVVLPGCGGDDEVINLAAAPTGHDAAQSCADHRAFLPPAPTPVTPPAPATVTSAAGAPPPPPQPAWPPSRPAEVSVAVYENNIGVAHPQSPLQMYWQSAFTTKDGTLIEWGTGDHRPHVRQRRARVRPGHRRPVLRLPKQQRDDRPVAVRQPALLLHPADRLAGHPRRAASITARAGPG